jgi:hypothetical protein
MSKDEVASFAHAQYADYWTFGILHLALDI